MTSPQSDLYHFRHCRHCQLFCLLFVRIVSSLHLHTSATRRRENPKLCAALHRSPAMPSAILDEAHKTAGLRGRYGRVSVVDDPCCGRCHYELIVAEQTVNKEVEGTSESSAISGVR
jgi:hypothetical protein